MKVIGHHDSARQILARIEEATFDNILLSARMRVSSHDAGGTHIGLPRLVDQAPPINALKNAPRITRLEQEGS